jgi:SHS2 domain-containing protein
MHETFDHTADLGLRIRSDSLEQLLVDAARALFSLFVVNLDDVCTVQEKTVEVAGDQYDYLLFDWLAELLYVFETQDLLLADFDVRVDERGLHAICRGEPVDRSRHELHHEVKAITYHGLKVQQDSQGWLAEVIVDI